MATTVTAVSDAGMKREQWMSLVGEAPSMMNRSLSATTRKSPRGTLPVLKRENRIVWSSAALTTCT